MLNISYKLESPLGARQEMRCDSLNETDPLASATAVGPLVGNLSIRMLDAKCALN
jgi:hypothetical protein